jgi:hypothetical protein
MPRQFNESDSDDGADDDRGADNDRSASYGVSMLPDPGHPPEPSHRAEGLVFGRVTQSSFHETAGGADDGSPYVVALVLGSVWRESTDAWWLRSG